MLGRPWVSCLFLTLAVGACTGKSDADGSGEGDGTSGSSGINPDGDGGNTDAGEADTSSATQGGGTGDGDGGSETIGGEDSGSGAETGTNDPDNPLDCGGTIYACGNGIDDDMDGLVDLEDPECTGPCDDDESSFATGIPGDNKDCKQDCFFDGNSGQGDDGCDWNLRCDPENPGANVNCEYTGGNNCEAQPEQSMMCIEFCEEFVPPGCDCFGCCTVQTPEGPIDIFLNSSPDCALDNLEACETCTQQIEECGNPCVPDECETCFGETEPPEGCGETECGEKDPCEATEDCANDYFCYLGCCYPPPPG